MSKDLLQYIDEKDKRYFNETELQDAYDDTKRYFNTYPGVSVGKVVFFNACSRGRILSFQLVCEEDDFEGEDKSDMDANGIYTGYQYVYGYNMDNKGFSEMGSVYILKDEHGNFRRRPLQAMQCFTL